MKHWIAIVLIGVTFAGVSLDARLANAQVAVSVGDPFFGGFGFGFGGGRGFRRGFVGQPFVGRPFVGRPFVGRGFGFRRGFVSPGFGFRRGFGFRPGFVDPRFGFSRRQFLLQDLALQEALIERELFLGGGFGGLGFSSCY